MCHEVEGKKFRREKEGVVAAGLSGFGYSLSYWKAGMVLLIFLPISRQ